MSLKVELKPGERILIGECVITNADQRTRFLIEGKKSDPPRKGHPDRGAGRHAGQAHLSGGAVDVHLARRARSTTATYFTLVHDLVRAAPSTLVANRDYQ